MIDTCPSMSSVEAILNLSGQVLGNNNIPHLNGAHGRGQVDGAFCIKTDH